MACIPAMSAIAGGALMACLLTSDFDGVGGGKRSDGGTPETGGVDGDVADGDVADGTSSDAGTSVGCDGSTAMFCADFSNDPITTGWDNFERTGGDGGRVLDTFVSPPSSFGAETLASTVDPGGAVELSRSFDPSVTQADLEFSVRLDEIDPGNSRGVLGEVYFRPAGLTYHLYLVARSGTDLLSEYLQPDDGGTQTVDHKLSSSIPRAAWTRLLLHVDLAAKHATLRSGSTVVADTALTVPFTSAKAAIKIGLNADPPAGPYVAHYDDVTFDAR
jgi:hypothetical protein